MLAGVLTLAATEARSARGVVLLAAYSLGLGVPFVVSGLAFARLAGVFAWVKRHFRVINVVAGALLVAFGVLLVTRQRVLALPPHPDAPWTASASTSCQHASRCWREDPRDVLEEDEEHDEEDGGGDQVGGPLAPHPTED